MQRKRARPLLVAPIFFGVTSEFSAETDERKRWSRPLVDEPLAGFNIRMTRPQINRRRDVAARESRRDGLYGNN